MGFSQPLKDHLASGITSLCRAWEVVRTDGTRLHFTDHDRDLSFEGRVFEAGAGMTASALAQGTGLAVDNSEASGVLSAEMIREEDIAAGRYDRAGVTCWLVNWAAPSQSVVLFRGTLGEVVRAGGGFRAELRGLAEALNQPGGRVYQSQCSAVLGDRSCGVALDAPGMVAEAVVAGADEARVFHFHELEGHDDRWFEAGRLLMLDGEAAGLEGVVKNDRLGADGRRVELWQALRAPVAPGDRVRLQAGCDRRAETCRLKFGNFANFRGFPHIPGEDWLSAVPWNQPVRDGGSRRR